MFRVDSVYVGGSDEMGLFFVDSMIDVGSVTLLANGDSVERSHSF